MDNIEGHWGLPHGRQAYKRKKYDQAAFDAAENMDFYAAKKVLDSCFGKNQVLMPTERFAPYDITLVYQDRHGVMHKAGIEVKYRRLKYDEYIIKKVKWDRLMTAMKKDNLETMYYLMITDDFSYLFDLKNPFLIATRREGSLNVYDKQLTCNVKVATPMYYLSTSLSRFIPRGMK